MFWLSGAAVVIGYLLGSIPTAWLVARRASRGETDIRQAGDGNAGARNVGRIFGRKWGVFVAAADIAKGAVAVLAFNALADLVVPLRADGVVNLPGMMAGVATIVGQIWPVWLRFRGGRGAATAIGVTAAVLPGPALLMMAPTLVILTITRSTTLALAFVYLSSVVVAKTMFGVAWGPIWYCLGVFVAVGAVHFWTVRFRNPVAETR